MKRLSPFYLLVILFIVSCSDDDGGDTAPPPEVNAVNFSTSVAENPTNGDVIGTLVATTTSGDITYSLVTEDPSGAISVDAQTGIITVADASLFDFETNPTITGVYRASVGAVSDEGNITINLTDEDDEGEFLIWSGPAITFTKESGADPDVEDNQDRITDNVWITRRNEGGQIYNAAVESSADKDASPSGTEWAEGNISEIADLTFTPFREAVGQPNPSIIGRELVLHLIDDDIYMQVVFTAWASNKQGGFAYTRPGSEN